MSWVFHFHVSQDCHIILTLSCSAPGIVWHTHPAVCLIPGSDSAPPPLLPPSTRRVAQSRAPVTYNWITAPLFPRMPASASSQDSSRAAPARRWSLLPEALPSRTIRPVVAIVADGETLRDSSCLRLYRHRVKAALSAAAAPANGAALRINKRLSVALRRHRGAATPHGAPRLSQCGLLERAALSHIDMRWSLDDLSAQLTPTQTRPW